ncbi:MAG: PAS domain S-box protein [Hyphomicrobium sp.]
MSDKTDSGALIGWNVSADLAAAKIAVIFLLFALIWIFASDHVLDVMAGDHKTFALYQTYKGTAFVATTAALIFWLVRTPLAALITSRDLEAIAAAQFRGVYDHALAGIAIGDKRGRIESCNRVFCDLLGYSEVELIGADFEMTIHPDDRLSYDEKIERLRAGVLPFCAKESRYLHKSGKPVWVRKVVAQVPGRNGEPGNFLVLAIDVTDSQLAAEALRESEQRLQYVMAATGDGVWDWSIKSGRVKHNIQWCRLMALDDSVLEHDLADLTDRIHADDKPKVEAAIKASLKNDAPYISEHRIRRADGSIIWVSNRGKVVVRNAEGHAIRMVGSVHDISDQKALEQHRTELLMQLSESEAESRRQQSLFRSIFECSPDCIIVTNLERQIVSVNPAFSQTFGYFPDELLGQTTRQLYSDEKTWNWVGEHTAAIEGVLSFECDGVRKSGETFPCKIKLATMLDQHGTMLGKVAILRDFAIERDRERALYQRRQFEALGRLTGGVAHDFNNLLTVISGNLQLLDYDLERPEHKKLLADAIQATEMGARLNQRLVTFARQRRLDPMVIDVNDLCKSLRDLLQHSVGERCQIVFKLDADPATVLIDISELENAMINLALNARDAMPGGGTFTIATSNERAEFEADGLRDGFTHGEFICLTASDSGGGMSDEVQSRAFDPFFTTKEQGNGSGLGLTTIQGFVRQSGGQVIIASQLGHGTTVKISLPRPDIVDTIAPVVACDTKPISIGNGEIVLLVEDNNAVKVVTQRRLEVLGYKVLTAENGNSALKLIEHNPRIDVVLTDIVMPGGMSGVELLKQLLAACPERAVILTSGFFNEAELPYTQDGYSIPVMQKPYSQAQLASTLARALQKTQGRSTRAAKT